MTSRDDSFGAWLAWHKTDGASNYAGRMGAQRSDEVSRALAGRAL
jgi:hypothetical protein